MNRATRVNVVTLAVLLAISGMVGHGLFEVLQENTPTGGLFIEAIGEGERMWEHGTEGAFTIIPNFLFTGLLAMAVSLCIIVWSIGFVHKRNGPLVLLLLFIFLFLVGGGVAQVTLFIPTWAASTRIQKPLTWWRQVLPEALRRVLAKLWLWFYLIGAVLLIVALVISVTGFLPGVSDADLILSIDWSLLGIGYLLYMLGLVAGFAYDIERQTDSSEGQKKTKERK
jgi:hypothetical protein